MFYHLDNRDLLANPFAVLGVSTREDRDAIARALDERLRDPDADEGSLHRAQQSLMAPRPRLQAEISWLIGLAPSRVRAIMAALQHDDQEALTSELQSTAGLASANLAMQMVVAHPSRSLIDILIGAYDAIDPGEIAETINAERAAAGFPASAAPLVKEALDTLRACHLETTLRAVTRVEHPGRLTTDLVEVWLAGSGLARDFVESLTERYDSWSVTFLSRFEERLDGAIARLRQAPKDAAALKDIVVTLRDWDEYSQPRQLICKHKHLDEPRSRTIYDKLRGLGLWLAEEQHEYRRALVISEALLLTFRELPSVIDQVPEDIEDLKFLARQAQDRALFDELMEAIAKAKDCLTLGTEIERGAFGPVGGGAAGRLYTAFAKAARGARGHEQADLPWLAVRQLAIELHNEQQETQAALRLTVAIRSFEAAQPSAEVTERLRDDEATLRRELLWREVSALSEQGRWAAALNRLHALESLAADAAERQKIATLRWQLKERRNVVIRCRVGWGVAAAVIGSIVLAALGSPPTPPRAANQPATPSTPARPSSESPPPARHLLSDDDVSGAAPRLAVESLPPAGSDRLLTSDQIRYCVFQGERLEAFRLTATTDAQIDHLNRLIDDWNSRCSRNRYREDSMQAVQSDLGAQKDRLQREGRALAAAGVLARADPGQAPPPTAGARLLSPAIFLADAWEVQRRLAALGYYTTTIDGIWGAGSRRALAEFKRRAGLPANADWDRTTQERLFQATDG